MYAINCSMEHFPWYPAGTHLIVDIDPDVADGLAGKMLVFPLGYWGD